MDRVRIRSDIKLILWTLFTAVSWNGRAFLSFVSFVLPGFDAHTLPILFPTKYSWIYFMCAVLFAPVVIIATFIVFLRTIVKRESFMQMRRYQRNWRIVLLVFNVLLFMMGSANRLTGGRLPGPDMISIATYIMTGYPYVR